MSGGALAQEGCDKVGVEVNQPIDLTTGEIILDFDMIAETGTRMVRLNFILGPWETPRDMDWIATYQEIVENFRSRNIEVYALVGAELVGDPLDNLLLGEICLICPSTAPALEWIDLYVDNFEFVVELFGDQITYFEAFNEPNNWPESETQAVVSPGWYAYMMGEIGRRRAENGWNGMKIVSGPLLASYLNRGEAARYLGDVLDLMYAYGGWTTFPLDGIGLHLYVAHESTDADVIRREMTEELDAVDDVFRNHYGSSLPIYISEFGWNRLSLEGSQEKQAESLRHGFEVLKQDSRVARAIWFSLLDTSAGDFGLYTLSYEPNGPVLEEFQRQACVGSGAGAELDFGFAIDTTGSMWDDITNVKASAVQISDAILARARSSRIAVTDFRDFAVSPYGGSGDYPYNVDLDFSSDREEVRRGIEALSIGWGNNFPESVLSGLMGPITGRADCSGDRLSAWRASAEKILLLIGDAPPHPSTEPFTGFTLQGVLDAANAGGNQGGPPLACPGSSLVFAPERMQAAQASTSQRPIRIYSILIGNDPTTRNVFRALADGTDGKFFTAPTAQDVVDAILAVVGDIGGPPPGNRPPNTAGASPSVSMLWPPNHRMWDVRILGVVDPEGGPVTITITGITQDEPVRGPGSGNKAPDASGVGTDRAFLRAERTGQGDSRIYRIRFTARDAEGAESTGRVFVCVAHDQGLNTACLDGGEEYDSTQP